MKSFKHYITEYKDRNDYYQSLYKPRLLDYITNLGTDVMQSSRHLFGTHMNIDQKARRGDKFNDEKVAPESDHMEFVRWVMNPTEENSRSISKRVKLAMIQGFGGGLKGKNKIGAIISRYEGD